MTGIGSEIVMDLGLRMSVGCDRHGHVNGGLGRWSFEESWTVYLYLILRRDECRARTESSGAVHWHGVMVSTGKATALGCAWPF